MNNNDKYNSLKTMLLSWYQNLVNDGKTVTEESAIENAITLNSFLNYNLDSDDLRRAVDDLMLTGIITQEDSVDVVDIDSRHMNWYESWVREDPDARQRRWHLYRGLLMQKGWQDNVLNALDKDASRTVDLMGNPELPGEWERYGLVIGEVQSGKTANYIGVLNKALDAGYKMIVVLGGHTDDLRKQTQKRIDSDLIGYDSSFYRTNIRLEGDAFQKGFIGFGRELQQYGIGTQAITTVDSDFRADSRAASMGQTLTGDPRIAVIKKNKAIIKNLTAFLRGRDGVIDVPLAVIDDEADWASINTKSEDDKTAINEAIRDLLSVSRRSTYLAITATPFANVFIDHTNEDDLFPRNYIRALKAPSNYRGVESYMTADARNDNPHTLQTDVDDVLAILPYKHKIDAGFEKIPDSMKNAIYSFLLATAIRRIRGDQDKPSSMMVNISRFNAVQGRICETIKYFIEDTCNIFRYCDLSSSDALPSQVTDLENVFQSVYPGVSEIKFSEIFPHVQEILKDTLVELVNSSTVKKRQKLIDSLTREDRESYENKPKIFIGGNILARGLTLEGLVVSYYLRKTVAADTLLQMGRWFGYRPRYEDLVRIWTAEEIIDLFEYAAEISSSLRREIGRMNDMGLTPEQFGLAIQQHPESFKITALSKSRNATELPAEVRLSGHVFESDKLSTKESIARSNLQALNKLVEILAEEARPEASSNTGRNHIWRGVDESLVREFLSVFSAHEADPFFGQRSSAGVQRIVDSLKSEDEPDTWNVMLVSGRGEKPISLGGAGLEIYPSIRNAFEIDENHQVLRFGNRRVASGNDLFNSLTAEQSQSLRSLPESKNKRTFSQQYVVDNALTNPTLMIYLAQSETGKSANGVQIPIAPFVAVSVAFPPDNGADRYAKKKVINVLANTVYLAMLREDMQLTEEDELEEES